MKWKTSIFLTFFATPGETQYSCSSAVEPVGKRFQDAMFTHNRTAESLFARHRKLWVTVRKKCCDPIRHLTFSFAQARARRPLPAKQRNSQSEEACVRLSFLVRRYS